MDSFDIANFKFEKARTWKKPGQLRKMANVLRVVELCVALLLISRLSTQLPVAVKNSTDYFRDFKVVVSSPGFVFVLGNAIVFVLFAKSAHFFSHDLAATKNSFYNEMVEKNEVVADHEVRKAKTWNRTKSQKSIQKHQLITWPSVSEEHYNSNSDEDLETNSVYPPDDAMSNEEFQRTIEAFIARQQKFQREEEFSAM